MFPNLIKFTEHLTIKLFKKPSCLATNYIIRHKKFLEDLHKAAKGALVVPGAVVGNYNYLVYLICFPDTLNTEMAAAS